MLYDPEPLVRWRAIEALGKVSKIILEIDPEKVRRQIRRILWLMNDESGGLCRNGPEAIGEVVFNNTGLLEEYGPILISFLSEEPFEAGTRNALARLAGIDAMLFSGSIPVIIKSLESDNPRIRGFSVKALLAMDDRSAAEKIETLAGDQNEIEDYDFDTGELLMIKIRDFVSLYLNNRR